MWKTGKKIQLPLTGHRSRASINDITKPVATKSGHQVSMISVGAVPCFQPPSWALRIGHQRRDI
jgi:hypothetical protein